MVQLASFAPCAVVGGGGTALRDFVSDAVGNATQDANYKGLYLPFYTVGTGEQIALIGILSIHTSYITLLMQSWPYCMLQPFSVMTGAGQQSFLNNTFQYAIGDFPLSAKDYASAER